MQGILRLFDAPAIQLVQREDTSTAGASEVRTLKEAIIHTVTSELHGWQWHVHRKMPYSPITNELFGRPKKISLREELWLLTVPLSGVEEGSSPLAVRTPHVHGTRATMILLLLFGSLRDRVFLESFPIVLRTTEFFRPRKMRNAFLTVAVALALRSTNAAFVPSGTISGTEFSPDDQISMGDAAGSIVGDSVVSTPPPAAPALEKNAAGIAMQYLAEVPSPRPASAVHVSLRDVENICERDYSQTCPLDYELAGHPFGSSSLICGPGPAYDGPCKGDLLDLSEVKSTRAKKTWASRCMRDWPCVQCSHQYSAQCPTGWRPSEGSASACTATADYGGPCAREIVDFDAFNIPLKKEWSARCRAWCKFLWWPT
ncbi:cpw-wpc domain-containing protein [Toxoplasma gondii ME49]|uniref:Cpw-wpc domain-containing protein n=2 Tax=Toxoplasma gondii TaxID=5811 RepID=A0A125YX04_TOXGV|nr:cpw-wpc domain-containing protein [Toxoplasma gondii ME49]EPT30703.1 cpw-wpc domain-containing protein [Toxoplasma gondii ME49]ESS31449.1 cpw-wpc domain-containing protein [Toxoplasma gondii VEG]|eukprot:XP_018637618.1 cpw-wpc domain-containing protein [Toxoplasma gondii ME49]